MRVGVMACVTSSEKLKSGGVVRRWNNTRKRRMIKMIKVEDKMHWIEEIEDCEEWESGGNPERVCYIVTNPLFKEGIYKFGRSKAVFTRLYQLGQYAGLPTEFELEFVFRDGSGSDSLEEELKKKYAIKQVKTRGNGYSTEYFQLSKKELEQLVIEHLDSLIGFDEKYLGLIYVKMAESIGRLFIEAMELQLCPDNYCFIDFVRVYQKICSEEKEDLIAQIKHALLTEKGEG
jgi:hypothetical protein